MGVLAEVGRLAVGAWSSGGVGGGYIAAGSYGGSIDTSFSSNTSPSCLEIFAVDIARAKLSVVTQVPTNDKFCSIDWSIPSRTNPAGMIAGGLSDGTVRIWDAASLLRPSGGNDEARGVLFGQPSAKKYHSASVRALEFNPSMPNRLATGAHDGEVLVWDLTNPSNGPSVRSPAGPQQNQSQNAIKEQITAVAWNRKVQHILGTATAAGVMNVWDLRQNKQVISIRNPRGRLPCSSLTWHPEVPTQVVITCLNDDSTGALLWDLRNASKHIMSYTHHSPNGVSSSSWCPHDTDLLLTSSNDSRTVAISVSTGEIIAEAPQAANANFDIAWSPRIPGMYLSSSLDGRLSINSLLTATSTPTVSSETVNAVAESFGEMAGGFQANVPDQSSRTAEAPTVTYNVTRAPKWLKRPSSISFGFGGWRATFGSTDGDKVNIESFSESFSGLKEGSEAIDSMLMDLVSDDPSPALNWCQNASNSAETPKEKMAWDALGIMFQTDSRRNLLKYLGFNLPPLHPGDEIAMPVYGLAQSQPLAVPVRPATQTEQITPENKPDDAAIDEITNGTAEVKLDGPAPWEVTDGIAGDDVNLKNSILDGDDTLNGDELMTTNKTNGSLDTEGKTGTQISFAGKSKAQIDDVIRQAVIVGDFKTAVEACLHINRPADALVIAHAGGPYLWQQTQSDYLTKTALNSGSSIVAAIAGPKSKLDDYIRQSAEGGKEAWKEALAVLLTYSPAEEIQESCTALGQRLLLKGDHAAALFCFICAGNTRMATTAWMRDRPSTGQVTTAMMADRVDRLVILVQRIRLLTAATLLAHGEREIGAVRALDEVSGSVLCEFAALLAAQGEHSLAITYLSNLDPSYTSVYGFAEDLHAKVSESLTMEETAATVTDQYGVRSEAMSMPYNNYDQPTYPSQDPYGANDMQPYNAPPPPPGGAWNNMQPAPPTLGASPHTTPAPPLAPISSSTPPVATPPRPSNVFTPAPTADRSTYDPSAAYSQAPDFNQNVYTPAPPAPMINSAPAAPPIDSNRAMMPPVPSAPPGGQAIPPVPMGGGAYSTTTPAMGGYMGLQPETIAPPPPPPTNMDAPPPMSYHSKARPGSGSTLPPSAEVAVAEGRRAKPLSTSGTPGGPPRRSTSTSSSLSAMGIDNVLLERADVAKIPGPQQVIVKALRGSYSYSRSLNQAPRYVKKLDDVSKRLGKLLAALNNGLIDKPVVDLLVPMAQSIEKGNYDEASRIVNTLTRQHWDSNSQWIQGLKRLIDCALTGR